MESDFIVFYADKKPIEGIENPGPHQIYHNPKLTIEKRVISDNVRADDIRVEMIYVGLCGTDVHLVQKSGDEGYIKSSAPMNIPEEGRVIGHEGVGRIIKTGRNVKQLRVGDYVTFESILICHSCDVCRWGRFNQCRHAKLVGLETDGLFGNIVDVPSILAHDVSDLAKTDKGLKTAACIEPAGVAYVACQNVRMRAGDIVVIFGAGPIGIFTALLAKLVFGASEIHVVEPVPFRRELAKKWSDHVYDLEEFFDNRPQSVNVVIEASGDFTNVNRIFRQIDANGRIVLLARSGEPIQIEAIDHMITNEISMIGSRGHLCGAFSDILKLYRKGRNIYLDEIVTNVPFGLEEVHRLLNSSEMIMNDNCKVLVRLN